MKKTIILTYLFALIGILPMWAQMQEPVKFQTELKKNFRHRSGIGIQRYN